jgi:hypothetical protein
LPAPSEPRIAAEASTAAAQPGGAKFGALSPAFETKQPNFASALRDAPRSTSPATVQSEAPRERERDVAAVVPSEPRVAAEASTAAAQPGGAKFGALSPASETKQPKLAAPARTGLSEEAAQLTALVSTLRQDHDPAGTLALVAQYRERFPNGALGSEVTLVAAEAQRALGRTAEALCELEKLTGDARGGELAVLRAELRAELGHCAEARAELDLLRGRLPPALRERAERVEAACR